MKKLIDYFRALGEETRIKIILMLFREEMCICELMDQLNLSQSAVSHHVKILKQAGLVNDRRDGKWTFYSINKEGFNKQFESLKELIMTPVEQYEYEVKEEPKVECPK
jgi:ArsR family transcriptional regulator, arsenate/arsenite/antimonite-responsive transcriptional repressor